jgi:hypothetical protein
MKGLLLYPEFPDSSFWSYRHIMPMLGAKAAFPPLGLLTFAALMPPEWTFELLDLNVERPSNHELRARIAAADAVFVSAMSVQKPSLVAVLAGAAHGIDTPWILGGDLLVWTSVLYLTGAEQSWLFFVLLLRVADQTQTTFRRAIAFSMWATACYAAMLVWVKSRRWGSDDRAA